MARELCRNRLKKSAPTEEHLRRLIGDWCPNCVLHASSQEQHLLASRLRETASFSFCDSLIVVAALDAGCSMLYSEDMQHGQVVDGRLTIINPVLSRVRPSADCNPCRALTGNGAPEARLYRLEAIDCRWEV